MPKMHADELDIDDGLVHGLLEKQFPEWAGLPLARVEPSGTDNAIYRLGDTMAVRLPRRGGSPLDEEREHRWVPWLAPRLPVAVPLPLARGRPDADYPWSWSVVNWLEGETPVGGSVPAGDLAAFVRALQLVDPAGGPEPGARRAEPLSNRDGPVRVALEHVHVPGALELWESAVAAPEWEGPRVWIHADLDARNVLVRAGRLTAVIDWGCLGVGDPAVDLMGAWKLLPAQERDGFRDELGLDDATWLRARGWALSQALIALDYYTVETNAVLVGEAGRWLVELLAS